VALIGCGGLLNEKDINSALDKDFCEFYAVGKANMLNKDFGTLLKNGEVELGLDPAQPEKYGIPSYLWRACFSNQGWLPSVKGYHSYPWLTKKKKKKKKKKEIIW